MTDLLDFAQQIEDRLAALEGVRQQQAQENESGMRERESRVRRFEVVAEWIHRQLIRPRTELLRGQFANLTMEHSKTPVSVSTTCRFERTDQFPASTRFSLGVDHEVDADKAAVFFDLEIIPVLMSFDGHHRFEFSLDSPDQDAITAWIEWAMFRFVDIYLQLPMHPAYQLWSTHRDPVCGMQVTSGGAVFKCEHGGKTHYFCSALCRDNFAASPTFYLPDRGRPLG